MNIFLIDTQLIVQSIYWSTLTSNSSVYSRTGCDGLLYYQAIQIIVIESGNYIFIGKGNLDFDGYISA